MYHHPNLILHPAPLLTHLFSLFYPLMLTIPTSLLQPLLSHLTYLSLLHYLTLLSLDPFKPSCHTSHSITGNSFISFTSLTPSFLPVPTPCSVPSSPHPLSPSFLPSLSFTTVAPSPQQAHSCSLPCRSFPPNPLHSSSHIIGQRLR